MSYNRRFNPALQQRPAVASNPLRLAIARFLTAGLAVGLLSNAALANEPEDTDTARDNAPQLQTVVVTAQKRAEQIQEVPVPITAITGNAVQEKNITTSADVERLAPNLSGQASGNTGGRTGKPRWFLRGIGTNDPNANQEGPLAVYVDEVVVGLQGDQNFPLFDLERVEVLRGPQGTLWGKNNTGGAIHFVSRKPGFKNSGYTRLGVGNYGTRIVEAATGGALVGDTIAGRAAIYYEKGDGWAENIVTGETGPKLDDFNGRFQLLANLSDDLDALLTLNIRQLSTGNIPNYIVGATSTNNVTTPNPNGEIRQGGSGYVPPYGADPDNKSDFFAGPSTAENSYVGATLKLNYSLGENTLTSITAFTEGKGDGFSSPGIPANTTLDLNATRDESSSRQFTQEIRLASPTTESFSWILGAYYYNLDADAENRTARFENGTTREQYTESSWDQTAKSYALFGNAKYRFTDRAALTVGLRQTWEEKDILLTSLTATDTPTDTGIVDLNPGSWWNPGGVTGTGLAAREALEKSASWKKTTWDITPEYRLNEDILLYGRVATGFRSGGFNQRIVRGAIIQTDPETLTDFELGAKTSWLDGRLIANAALFYYRIKDLQLNIQQQVPGTTITSTAGSSDGNVKGFELEIEALPTNYWRIATSLGLLRTEYTDFKYSIGGNQLDASGNEFYRAPRTAFRLDTDYRFPLANGDQLILGTDWSYRSHIYHNATVQNDPVQETPGYWLGNARLIYQTAGRKVQFSGYVNNLTDKSEKVLAQIVNTRGVYPISLIPPRTFGVQATFNF